ncbi:family 2 glycosyl transferase [Candidatus Magnetomorum sp. HK-1]|nr:family 2 glycosyl transferase [Candidatus Magnetomorum sp. HK-1]
MPKLIIQIPCYNEEKNIGKTLSDLPRRLEGIDHIEYLIIDDCSSDNTISVAKSYGANHIVQLTKHQGLAVAFITGIKSCLEKGADIIVNTDADNQYVAKCIQDIILPIVEKRADIVIGERPIEENKYFSYTKKKLQRLGSWVVRLVSNTDIPDATSGFRAMNRNAAMQLNVFSHYSYVLETIIQAGQKGLMVTSVPIQVNPPSRPSRLVKNIPSYLYHSIMSIVRIFVIYRPFRFFMSIGSILTTFGLAICVRFLYFYFFTSSASGHLQSLILAAILILMGVQFMISAFFADIISVNRQLLEELQSQSKEKK